MLPPRRRHRIIQWATILVKNLMLTINSWTHSIRRHCLFVHHYLPRKEVIHPQLPLRMPCYDFTLITNPTVVPDLTRGLLVLPALLVWRAIIFVKLRIDVPIVPADFPHTTSSNASSVWGRRYYVAPHQWSGDPCESFQRWHRTFQSHFVLSVTSKHFFWRMEW